MKHKYLVIADADTVLGFRSAGVPGVAVDDAAAAAAALKSAQAQDVGIVIVTEEVADMARADVDALRFGGTLPMVVEIPSARGPQPGRRTLSAVIREAIGIKV